MEPVPWIHLQTQDGSSRETTDSVWSLCRGCTCKHEMGAVGRRQTACGVCAMYTLANTRWGQQEVLAQLQADTHLRQELMRTTCGCVCRLCMCSLFNFSLHVQLTPVFSLHVQFIYFFFACAAYTCVFFACAIFTCVFFACAVHVQFSRVYTLHVQLTPMFSLHVRFSLVLSLYVQSTMCSICMYWQRLWDSIHAFHVCCLCMCSLHVCSICMYWQRLWDLLHVFHVSSLHVQSTRV